jgi:hypothetical protein
MVNEPRIFMRGADWRLCDVVTINSTSPINLCSPSRNSASPSRNHQLFCAIEDTTRETPQFPRRSHLWCFESRSHATVTYGTASTRGKPRMNANHPAPQPILPILPILPIRVDSPLPTKIEYNAQRDF